MDPVSHVALFYLIGKRASLEKLWAGMAASILPDASLVLLLMTGSVVGISGTTSGYTDANLLLHSMFSLLFLLPIMAFSFRYFVATFCGYSLHLLLDYLTHSYARMPFFPLSKWNFPIFVRPYFDPSFLMIANAAILVAILIFEWKRLASLFVGLFKSSARMRFWLVVGLYVLVATTLSVWYATKALDFATPSLYAFLALFTANSVLVGVLFLNEVYLDENVKSCFSKVVKTLFKVMSGDSKNNS